MSSRMKCVYLAIAFFTSYSLLKESRVSLESSDDDLHFRKDADDLPRTLSPDGRILNHYLDPPSSSTRAVER